MCDKEFKIVKYANYNDDVVLEDGTTISVRRRRNRFGETKGGIVISIKRDSPIGKIVLIKKEKR